MKNIRTFDPNGTYQKLPDNKGHIQLFISPHQYVQDAGALDMIGEYISMSVSGRAGIMITPGRDRALGTTLEKSLTAAGITNPLR